MKPTLITFLATLTILGCGGPVARVAEPAAVYDQITVEEYTAAEEHFAGGPKVMASMAENPFVDLYWNDARCQELLDKRDLLAKLNLGLGVLTGGSGLTTVIPKDMEKEKKEAMEITFGSLTLGFGVATAIIAGTIKSMTARYEQNCRTERPAPDEHPASDEEPRADGVRAGSSETDLDVDGGVE